MKHILILAGAAALVFAGPAYAKGGNGHGNGGGGGGGHGNGQGNGNGHGNGHAQGYGYTKHGKGSLYGYQKHGKGRLYGYGAGGCPPGLAKKNNGCMPPGQARKLYNVGQRFPLSYGNRWSYNQVPSTLRSRYGFNPNDRYYYGNGYVYRVDPRTQLVQQVVSALVR